MIAHMPPPSNAPTGTGLTFTGMTDKGINHGLDLQFNLADKTAKLFLCVGKEDNRVLITGTTPASRQRAVLAAIDQFGQWGHAIDLWMVSEKNGTLAARTAPVKYVTHVKPYYGWLTITGFSSDQPPLTYPGNGKGRVLSKPINDRYYFIYGGMLETNNQMRGFDCTTFPMALFSVRYLPHPGYGKQLCDALGASKCDLEQIKTADLQERFNTIPAGLYVLFSEGHVLLYNSDIKTLYEFNYGGFRKTPAGGRHLQATHNLWWMRKLSDSYRPFFF